MLYVGYIAGALQRENYLYVIRATGFADIEIKKEQQFTLPDAISTKVLIPEDVALFQQANPGVLSIMFSAKRPVVTV